jgi:hypothetical protein
MRAVRVKMKKSCTKTAFWLGSLAIVIVGSNVLYRKRFAYQVDVGTLADTRANRILILKTFSKALLDNQIANYVGITWRFSNGDLAGKNIEIGLDRTSRNMYFHVYKAYQGCYADDYSIQDRISQIVGSKHLPDDFVPDLEWPWFWNSDCLEHA